MKKAYIILLFILPLFFLDGQQFDANSFNQFINRFTDVSFPLEPTQYFTHLTAYQKIRYIKKVEYDKYLRTRDDSFWKFNENYEYCFGGKKKLENCWLIFYQRSFVPEDYDKSIGETILETMTFEGKLISRITICGGYGDTKDFTFQSKIYSPEKIEINYTLYTDKKMIGNTNTYETKETKETKYYCIQKDGKIELKK
jgi:hypothetical protein